jgi:chemotaxis protein CheD
MSHYLPTNEFEIRLYGGSNMYAHSSSPTIGERNVAFAKEWLSTHNLAVTEEDILGEVCRTLLFDLANGSVKLQRYQQEENRI